MNFGQMIEKIRFRVGNRTDLDNLIKDNINRAYLDIATREQFTAGGKIITFSQQLYFPTLFKSSTFQTVQGTQIYNLASDVLWVTAMKNATDHIPISFSSFRGFYNFIGKNDRGKPVMAYIENQTVYLYPVPDGQYTIRYWYKKRVSQLVNSSDSPELPEEWHEAVLLLATAITFYDILEEERGDRHMLLLENWIIEHLGQESLYTLKISSKST